ncbi:MAG TPA: hypothetical protein VFV34_27255 [Blastocatellia bacterium]|nr:hypothetical protein [Blastocatellia bacterium]
MSSRKRNGKRERRPRKRSRAVALVVVVVVVMTAGTGLLAGARKEASPAGTQIAPASLSASSPSKEYVYAGGRIIATEEPPGSGGSGCGTAPSPPTGLEATAQLAQSIWSVNLIWNATINTHHYVVQRSENVTNPSGWQTVGTPTTNGTVGNPFPDGGRTANTTYVYQVFASEDAAGNCLSAASSRDIATTINYSEAISTGVTIRANHLLELRTAVNAVRTAAGFSPPFDWPDASSPGVTVTPASGGQILWQQVQKLRNRLNEARTAIGLQPQSFSNQPLTAGTKVFANHILELRQGVQ